MDATDRTDRSPAAPKARRGTPRAARALEQSMDPTDLAAARARLRAERAETAQRLAALTGTFEQIVDASRASNADDEHDPEGSTIAFERSQVQALIDQAERHLAELDAAEARVEDGRYGTCERCNLPIAPGRLEARPVARTCISCAAG